MKFGIEAPLQEASFCRYSGDKISNVVFYHDDVLRKVTLNWEKHNDGNSAYAVSDHYSLHILFRTQTLSFNKCLGCYLIKKYRSMCLF